MTVSKCVNLKNHLEEEEFTQVYTFWGKVHKYYEIVWNTNLYTSIYVQSLSNLLAMYLGSL